jgi:tetratricopeptide (TPR) repeat protein
MDNLQGAIEKAETLHQEGKLVEAIQLVQNALPVVEKVFGAKSPELAKQVIFLGRLYLAKADEVRKDETIRIAVATVHIEKMGNQRWEKLFLRKMAKANLLDNGEKDIEFRSDEYLAVALWAKATQTFESALSIQRSIYGPTHPAIAQTMLMLVALYDYFQLEEESHRLKYEAEGIKQRIAASLEASGLGADIWEISTRSDAASTGHDEATYQSVPGSTPMEYCEIIRQITEKLTGNEEWDTALLNEQAELYRGHPWGDEINRAIGRLTFYLLPEEKQREVGGFIERHKVSEESILHEAKIKLEEGRLGEAEVLVQSLLPDKDMPVEDKNSVFQAFREPFERILYDYKFKPGKRIRPNQDINMQALFFYAYLLVEKKDFDAALEVLNRGLKYNPVDVHFLFEAAEIYKIHKDWPKFRSLTDRCHDFSFRPDDVARVYRNYGYMFVEREELDAAICCYATSRLFCDHEKAQSELFYISERLKKSIDLEMYMQKGDKILSKYGIAFGPSQDVLGLSYTVGKQCEEEGNTKEAIYYFSIFAGLTRDNEVLKKVDDLERAVSVRERELH